MIGPTPKGKYILLYNQYTYAQDHNARRYYCSKSNQGCKAKLKLDQYGKIEVAEGEHLHEPPRYVKIWTTSSYPHEKGRIF